MIGKRRTFVEQKILDWEQAKRTIASWQLKGNRIVFTNGCFDILHKGHVTYLSEAAAQGERLVVALNTDASVRQLGKGPERPINDEAARAMVMASLGFVDLVVFFGEDTPLEVIAALRPDILVKGADYDPEATEESDPKYIVGSKEVRSWGGEVKAIDLVPGFSTTSILNKSKG